MTTSYSLFGELLRHYFAWPPDADDEHRVARIVTCLEEFVGRGYLSADRAGEIGPLLGNLLSLPFGNEWDLLLKNTSPDQVRNQTFLAVRDFFLAVAQQQPVVLALEDLHWADSLSVDLIAFLIEALSAVPLLLLCVYRPEREHKCWRLGTIASQKCPERYAELHLRDLTPPQSRQLVASLLGLEKLPTSIETLILERTRGNPFFVEEVVHAYIEGGIIYRDGHNWRAREGLEGLTAPESVQSVILSRADRLEPEVKHVLQTASIVGRLFRRRLLEETLRCSGVQGAPPRSGGPGRSGVQESHLNAQTPEHLNACLWELEERGLIYQERVVPEEEYSFKHVLTQETIYQGLPRGRRAALHRQVAEAIEAVYREGLEEQFEQLAHHHELSGTDATTQQRALGYWMRAAERAHRAAAYHEEAALLSRAIGIAERLEQRELIAQLRGQRGIAFHRVAMWPEARPDLEAGLADQTPERGGERIQLLVELSLVCHWLLDIPSSRRHATEALALAEAAGRDDLAAGAMGALALADQSDGKVRESLSQFERAFERAGEIRIAPLAPAVHWSALVLYLLGRYPEAVERAHLAIEVGRAVNDSTHTVLAMGDLGLALMASGRYAEALRTMEEARQFGQAHGIQRGIARCLGLRGGLCLELSDFAGAETLAREAIELARSLNWGHPIIFCGIDLLLNFARSYQVGRAEKLVDEVAEHVRAGAGCHGWGWDLRFAQARAEIALARGDWHEAVRWAEDAIRRSQASGRVKYQVAGLQTRGQALAGLGRKREAIAALREATALARQAGDPTMFLRAATALLGIEGDEALAAEAGSTAQRIALALPDGEMRHRFESAEPVRLLRGWIR